MGAASSRPHEEAEDWEDHFQHEYEQPTAANWAEDEEEEASVSVHVPPPPVPLLSLQIPSLQSSFHITAIIIIIILHL